VTACNLLSEPCTPLRDALQYDDPLPKYTATSIERAASILRGAVRQPLGSQDREDLAAALFDAEAALSHLGDQSIQWRKGQQWSPSGALTRQSSND
jgi:hypothetical protein